MKTILFAAAASAALYASALAQGVPRTMPVGNRQGARVRGWSGVWECRSAPRPGAFCRHSEGAMFGAAAGRMARANMPAATAASWRAVDAHSEARLPRGIRSGAPGAWSGIRAATPAPDTAR
jgi:hypothetical protein